MSEPADEAAILIVDDNPANLDLLAQMLRTRGYRTRAVPSGAMAIESARFAPPDLVLLDIKMPGLDGYETCQAFKADPELREIPVIFISALDDAWDKVRPSRSVVRTTSRSPSTRRRCSCGCGIRSSCSG